MKDHRVCKRGAGHADRTATRERASGRRVDRGDVGVAIAEEHRKPRRVLRDDRPCEPTYNQLFRDMLAARRFLVSGRVQGVGFRYFTHAAAVREGVTGWVRNLDDGRVEALVEGDPAAVDRVERAIRTGPPGARVDKVTAVPLPANKTHTRFSIT